MASSLISVYFLILFFAYSKLLLVSAQGIDQLFYNGFLGETNLHLDGVAEIHSNGLLQLTNFSKQQTGHAFYKIPLNFSTSSSGLPNPLSFSTNFVFAMVPEIPNISGHGIVFAISPSLDFSQAVASQYFGILNNANNGLPSNHLVAVELDTVKSPEFDDIDGNHVGIDINNLRSFASAPVAYYSSSKGSMKGLELISGDSIQIWIDYDGVEKLFNVTVGPAESPQPNQPLLSKSIGLSSTLLDSMYVGFSAATGVVASSHYILGWSFNKSGPAQNLELSNLPSLPRQGKQGGNAKQNIIVSLIMVSVLLIFTISGIISYAMRQRYEEIQEDWEQEYGPQRFSYKDLYTATKGFKEKELLGVGGFGNVYKGVLPVSKVQVAVKKISHDSKQGMKEFVAEIACMGRLRHRNLVQLLGYSRRKGELLLVYDYMPNGSLEKFLFNKERPSLNWAQRYQILKGVASALVYLHEDWDQIVLHRDVKASNVLLDADFNGRLGDFGLARLYDHGANPQTTHVVGTIGYIAPELSRTGKATTSTDVFAFGAFLLEVACGRRPIELQGLPEEMILVDWVIASWKEGAILETRDLRLDDDYVVHEVELVLKLGVLCSHSNPAARPSMRQVMQYLDGVALVPEIFVEGASFGPLATDNEASAEYVMSVSSLSGRASALSALSNESILHIGR